VPSKEQWSYWKDHPCTQAMLTLLREDRELGFEEMSYGSGDNELIRLGLKIGKINSLTGIINMTFIPQEEENDGRNQE
jgi:hypothetical protein